MSRRADRRLEMSVTAVFVVAVLLVAVVLVFSGGLATAKQIATLRLFGGRVDVEREDGTIEEGTAGESLHEGDTVRTGPDGLAAIEYFDGSVTRLDHDTVFSLLALEKPGEAADSKVIETEQTVGNSYNRVTDLTDASSRFQVRTPVATASAAGTVYAVLVSDAGTTIAVMEGAVTATSSGETVAVPAGKMVIVGSDGSASKILDISQEILESDWITFNRCTVDQVADCPDETEEPGPEGGEEQGGGQAGQQEQEGGSPPGPTGGQGEGGPPPAPELNQAPLAGFTASPTLGPAPLTVVLFDTSSDPDGDALTRRWSFGDGSSSFGSRNLRHTYRKPGVYAVTLVVSDPDGATDAKSRLIHVGSAHDTVPPVVKITHAPDNPTKSREATFRFTSSEKGTGFVCTLDGRSARCGGGSQPGSARRTVGTVHYSNLSVGAHAFSVSVTDASGNMGSDSYAWTIGEQGLVFDHIVISPSSATITLGDSQRYQAQAFDADGHSMGNVTASTAFSIAPDGSCDGATCTPAKGGDHTVTGTFSGDSDTAALSVEEPPPTCPTYALRFHTRPPKQEEAGHQFNVQVKVDVLEGGSSEGPLDISLVLGEDSFSDGETDATWTGQGTVTFNHLRIDEAGTYTLTAVAACAIPTEPATITITDDKGGGASAGPFRGRR